MYKIIGSDKKEYGPVSAADILDWIREGRANGQTLAQPVVGGDWRPLTNFPEFAHLVAPPSLALPVTGSDTSGEVKAPAILLIIGGSASALLSLLGIIQRLLGLAPQWSQFSKQTVSIPPELIRFLEVFAGLPLSLATLGMSIIVLLGGISMLKLRRRNLAMAGAIVALLCGNPCCCPLGLVGGIWALIVLGRPEVRSQFK